MADISSKAAGTLCNKKGYNGNELQNQEFSDGAGLDFYDFNARTYDQQVGRFIQIDPESEVNQESYSPFHFGFNNPILHSDPDGRNPGLIIRGASILLRMVRWTQSLGNPAGASSIPATFRDVTALPSLVPLQIKSSSDKKEGETSNGTSKSKEQIRADKLSEKERPGQNMTPAGKNATKDLNKKKNGGETKCDNCGTTTQPAQQHKAGETPPRNETHIDHIDPKSNGGSGTPNNAQVLCRGCNLEKGSTPPPTSPPATKLLPPFH